MNIWITAAQYILASSHWVKDLVPLIPKDRRMPYSLAVKKWWPVAIPASLHLSRLLHVAGLKPTTSASVAALYSVELHTGASAFSAAPSR